MNFLSNCLKGIAIGAGAILPGISSGVLCVIFGIYEKLLDSRKVIYSDLTKEELVKEFKKEYPKIFEKYPTFLEILQKHPYGNKKDVLLDENFKIKISTNRKMILCFIDKNKTKSHKLDLIQALFEPDYLNLSNEMTSAYPTNKIKKLERFLENESKKII